MNPLDIPQLDWADFCGNPAVNAAYRDLLAVADRPVLLHDHALIPDAQTSSRVAWSNGIHVFLILNEPHRDCSLVHELLHEILIAEGYCTIAGIPSQFEPLSSILHNEMHHPEIFRRMQNDYRLDPTDYWGHWQREMRLTVDEMKEQASVPRFWLDHFTRIFTWFFQFVSGPYLPEVAVAHPLIYQAVVPAVQEVAEIGFTTAEHHRRSMEVVREHLLQFCERFSSVAGFGTGAGKLIEGTKIMTIYERDKTVTATELMNCLKRYGFKPSP